MSSAKNDTNGDPIAVTLLGDPLAAQLKAAAKGGGFQVNVRKSHKSLPQGVTTANFRDMMYPLGVGATGFPGFYVVIVNSLPAPLVLADCEKRAASQIGYPAIADFGKHVSQTHQIPAAFDDPRNPGSKLYGVGAYHYLPDSLGEFEYAWSFSYKPGGVGPLVAIAIKYGSSWINPISAVTSDLSAYNNLGAFYDSLSKSGDTVPTDAGAETTLWASYSAGTYYIWVHDSKSTD